MEDKLKEIFGYVSNWLSFAEAKNGALVVLNGACIIGALTVVLGVDYKIDVLLRIYLIIVISLLLISTSIALLSFLPMTSTFKNCGDNDNEDSILLFYGDIAKCKNSRQYVLRLYREYFEDNTITEDNISKLEDDYAKEIIYNARVTVRKYECFKIALFLTISAFISIPIVILVCIIIKIYNKISQI